MNILLILFAPEIIAVFAPKAYYEAIWVVPSVALSVFFMFLYSFFATFEFYYEKTTYVAAATVGGAILNIILNYIGIHRLGYLAAGYTTLFSYILFALLHYLFMNKVCDEFIDGIRPYNGKMILGIAALSCAIGFGCMALYQHPIIRYSIVVFLGIVALVCRKKLISLIKSLLQLKKQKVE